MKICIFPADPIKEYFSKGEIKSHYFNPLNIFDEVHIISFTEKDINESEVQSLVGNAKLKIHSVGKINIKNRKKNVDRIKSLVKIIKPDIIRAYNPLIQGWFAAVCASELNVPFYLSLHTQYDRSKKLKKNGFKRYLGLKFSEKFLEPFVLKKADKITIAYRIIEAYVSKRCTKNPELLYNSIDYERFSKATPIESLKKPLIISVGSLIQEKNHQCVIKAMKNVDAFLLIIGSGKLYEELQSMIKKMKLEEKVMIKQSVPNDKIQDYYKSATIFALAYDPNLEGLPIPVIEAIATGLPVVIPFPKQGYSDGLDDLALFTERNPSAFAKNINKLLTNSVLQKELSAKSQIKAKEFDKNLIEKREAEIYKELLSR
jgi:glycosyltransferase involved in cell wall biosynthesis